ncbi:MAG TPA: DUF192 domain-containing protein [Clostridiales bacterium]|nr:DUF192 domain-containing protein [Clostridiales bacterium]
MYRAKINNIVILNSVTVAENFFVRLKGLMFKKNIPKEYGLWIKPANGIHTHWMRFSIDILYLDCDQNIIRVYKNIPPWRIIPPVWGVVSVLEMNAGVAEEVWEGEHIVFEKTD